MSFETALQAYRAQRLAQARAELDALVAAEPEAAAAWHLLGVVLDSLGESDGARAALERAVRLAPQDGEAQANLGRLLFRLGENEAALAPLAQALRIDPQATALRPLLQVGYRARASRLYGADDYAGAEADYRALVALDPDDLDAAVNLGAMRYLQADLPQAIALLRAVIAWAPTHANAHWNLSQALIAAGQWHEGWIEYEWRWPTVLAKEKRDLPWPLWPGEPKRGCRLLVFTEQGFGDAFMYARYLPLLVKAGLDVTLEIQPEIQRLFRSLGDGVKLLARGSVLSGFDYQIPLQSLPRIFDSRPETMPAPIPYLRAEAERQAHWAQRLGTKARPRIGLAWRGSRSYGGDRGRSIALAMLAPILDAIDAEFFSLQKGEAGEIDAAGLGRRIVDVSDEIDGDGAFLDTAAILANLDLTISVDTAVAHLAGAMGRPVWLMLARPADSRWMLDRADSPCYPNHRLFRQARTGDWPSVIGQVTAALGAWRRVGREVLGDAD